MCCILCYAADTLYFFHDRIYSFNPLPPDLELDNIWQVIKQKLSLIDNCQSISIMSNKIWLSLIFTKHIDSQSWFPCHFKHLHGICQLSLLYAFAAMNQMLIFSSLWPEDYSFWFFEFIWRPHIKKPCLLYKRKSKSQGINRRSFVLKWVKVTAFLSFHPSYKTFLWEMKLFTCCITVKKKCVHSYLVCVCFPIWCKCAQRGWRDAAYYLSPAMGLSQHEMPLGAGSCHEGDMCKASKWLPD